MKRRGVTSKSFFTSEESARIAAEVGEAERGTSAEIKVVVLGHSWMDLRDKAARVFRKHGLHNTKDRNCVMILLVVANREFLVYGDKGIHEHVRQTFWNDVRDEIGRHFRANAFDEGVCAGVRLIGARLAEHFPAQADDVDELSNEVIHDA